MKDVNLEELKKLFDYNIFEMRVYLNMYKSNDDLFKSIHKNWDTKFINNNVDNKYSYFLNFKEIIKNKCFEDKIQYIDKYIKSLKDIFNEYCVKNIIHNYYNGFNRIIDLIEEMYNFRINLIKKEYGK